MPMFYIPKPRRFRYEPRFYDPDKERWEALKAAHALSTDNPAGVSDEELEYFQEKVRRMDESPAKSKITWKDAFRKREMPQFHYTPRFSADAAAPSTATDTAERLEEARQRTLRIKRRFDVNRDLQRKQQGVWIKVALVLMVFYLVYRFYGPLTQFIYNIFF